MQESKQQIFQEEQDLLKREVMIEANCLRPEEAPVKKFYTEEEMTCMRKEFAANASEIDKLETELEQKRSEINAKKKPFENINEALLKNIDMGFSETIQQVYLFDDQEAGMMNYYDNKGELYYSRRLAPNEKQTNIISMSQKQEPIINYKPINQNK